VEAAKAARARPDTRICGRLEADDLEPPDTIDIDIAMPTRLATGGPRATSLMI
jgi:hypothetical protein